MTDLSFLPGLHLAGRCGSSALACLLLKMELHSWPEFHVNFGSDVQVQSMRFHKQELVVAGTSRVCWAVLHVILEATAC